MKKIIVTYGLISGVVAAVLMFAMALYVGKEPERFKSGEVFGYAGIILSMVFVFLGVRAYREQMADGQISFGKGFQIGILISVISCLCYVLAWMIVSETLMPDFMEQFARQTLEQMKKDGATEAAIAAKAAKMQQFVAQYKNPLFKMAITFMEPFWVGLLVSLLSAAILRRK